MEPPEYLHGHTRKRSGSGMEDEGQQQQSQQQQSVQGHLTEMVFAAGSRQVKEAFHSYGRIDLFRPYFDVEPKKVRNRLFQSLIPRKPSDIQAADDLYGPTMLIFTLVALLLFNMKASGYVVQDGTLIGTAFFTCFAYWFFTSMAIYTMTYIFTCDIPMVNVFALLGYALFGHCAVVLLTSIFHPIHSHLFFYALLLIFGGASCLRMSVYLASKAKDKTHKLILAGVVSFLHICFLLYLHFGFHATLEELEEVFRPEIEEMLGESSPDDAVGETVAKAIIRTTIGSAKI